MSRDHILHFTIGPVQGFIEQARRTRDFWAGSFLLAWLSAIAMKEAEDRGAEIVFPKIDGDNMMAALRSGSGEGPPIGTVPNRFKALVSADFNPEWISHAVLNAWTALGEAVWNGFIAKLLPQLGNDTRGIWERQISGFWELFWIMDGDPKDRSDGDWIDLRKNWRSHRPSKERGDHCTMMGDWQEISGWTGYADRLERKNRQREFWDALRTQDAIGSLNLVENERLCAIALVRRLFPLLAKNTLRSVSLWETGAGWPSTGHMAAVRWIADAVGKAPSPCRAYFDFVANELVPQAGEERRRWSRAERRTPVRCLRDMQPFPDFAGLDANLFFRDNLINRRTVPLPDDPDQGVGPTRKRLLAENDKLVKALKLAPLPGQPRPYYALLRMDGDHVGALLKKRDERVVGAALAEFASEAQNIVFDGDGVVVYAGGDDLLALLPLDSAICVARQLEQAYRGCFENRPDGDGARPTTSASIVIADQHEPLRGVLRQSQLALERVAKAENGRDSLVIVLLKPSGLAAQWVQRWIEPNSGRFIPDALLMLTQRIRDDRDISARFSYTLHRRFLATLGSRFRDLCLDPSELKSRIARHPREAPRGRPGARARHRQSCRRTAADRQAASRSRGSRCPRSSSRWTGCGWRFFSPSATGPSSGVPRHDPLFRDRARRCVVLPRRAAVQPGRPGADGGAEPFPAQPDDDGGPVARGLSARHGLARHGTLVARPHGGARRRRLLGRAALLRALRHPPPFAAVSGAEHPVRPRTGGTRRNLAGPHIADAGGSAALRPGGAAARAAAGLRQATQREAGWAVRQAFPELRGDAGNSRRRDAKPARARHPRPQRGRGPQSRVRLAIDADTGTAAPGLLFATQFVRPAANVALVVGIDSEAPLGEPHSPVAFGGENRWAWIEESAAIRMPEPPEFARADDGHVLYTAIFSTPADLKTWPKPGEALGDLPGEVVSAAIVDRPLRPGEWRSVGEGKGPQPSPPLLPAGSTWFLRASADAADAVRQSHRRKIGRRTAWGFGEVLIGTWRDAFAQEARR